MSHKQRQKKGNSQHYQQLQIYHDPPSVTPWELKSPKGGRLRRRLIVALARRSADGWELMKQLKSRHVASFVPGRRSCHAGMVVVGGVGGRTLRWGEENESRDDVDGSVATRATMSGDAVLTLRETWAAAPPGTPAWTGCSGPPSWPEEQLPHLPHTHKHTQTAVHADICIFPR